MRIDRLDLIAFGPFAGASLDLSAGEFGLHVIHGPNEAGKSSSLRALRPLFFGFKHQTADDFRHPYKDLRVGASLRLGDGSSLDVIRRKALKKSLYRAPEDREEVEESLLADRFLGGISAESFEGMFTLDHASLSAGGRATLDANGEFAEILFGAGLNLPRLRTYQKTLESQIDDLFKPRGEKPKINRGLTQLDEAREAIQDASLRGPDWHEKTSRLEALRGEKAKVDAEWAGLDRERKRLERIHKALPDLARRRDLIAEMGGLADARSLAEDFADRRRRAEEMLRDATRESKLAASDRDRLAASLAELPPRDAILDEADVVESLGADLGGERKAAEDRVVAARARDDALLRARVHLDGLGLGDADPEAVELARVRPGIKAQIQTLQIDGAALRHDQDALRKDIAASGRAIDSLEAQIASLPAPRSGDALGRVLKRVEDREDLAGPSASATREVTRMEREVRNLREKLGPGPTDPGELARLPVPSPDAIQAFETRLNDAETRRDRLASEVVTLEDRMLELDAKIERLQGEAELPDEAALRASRLRRDEGWGTIKVAWREGQGDPDEVMGRAFEDSTRRADDLADLLRNDAARIAEAARDRAERGRAASRLDVARVRRDEALAQLEEVRSDWLGAWARATIEPRSPREMASWAADHSKLLEKASTLAEKADDLAAREASRADAVEEIHRELASLGESSPVTETLSKARERADAVVEAIRDEAAKRRKLLEKRDEEAVNLASAELSQDEAAKTLEFWASSWDRAVRPLGLDGDASAASVTATIDATEKFFENRDAAAKRSAEIRDGETATERFRARLLAMANRLAPDLASDDPEAVVTGLSRRLREALENDTRRAIVLRQSDEKETSLREANTAIASAREILADLGREAGAISPDALPEIEARSARRRLLETELAAVEARTYPLAAGKTLDEFAEEAFALDADALPALLQTIEEDYKARDFTRQELSIALGRAENQVDEMKSNAKLAKAEAAAADREHLMGSLDSAVDRYVHLKLAWAVLRDAIEEFRKRNQAPVLERAGKTFAALTLGSFADLRVDLDDKTKPILVGIRPDGKAVGVEGMSVGTVDQLFLALKLALLDHYLSTHEALPLVVDDLLIQFDDARAGAALEALADLSGRTQVLFFTHHDHLVELARDRLPPDVLFVHRLGAGETAGRPAQIGANGLGS